MLMCGSVVQNWWDEIKFRGILGGEDAGRQQESGRKTFQPTELATELLIYSQKRIIIIEHLSPAVLWDVDIVRQISNNPGTPLPAESHESRLNCDACPVYYMFTCQTCSPWICGGCKRRGTLPGRVPASSWPPSREEAGTGRLRWSWWRSPPRSPLPCSTSHVTRDTWHVTRDTWLTSPCRWVVFADHAEYKHMDSDIESLRCVCRSWTMWSYCFKDWEHIWQWRKK